MALKCGVTKKIVFKSHESALTRAGEILTSESSNRSSTPYTFNAYKCEFCGGYHLTGKKFMQRLDIGK